MLTLKDFTSVINDTAQCLLVDKGSIQTGINPADISDVLQLGEENRMEDFWKEKGYTKELYIDIAKNYINSLEEIRIHGDLNHLAYDNPIRRANETYNSENDPINLIEYDGSYIFDGSGRHRILAAQELQKMGYGITIPARVTKFINPSKIANNSFNNPQTISFKNNMTPNVTNDLEVQLQKLIELKQFLLSFSQLLESNKFSYRTKFDILKQTGLSRQFIDSYKFGHMLPEMQIIDRIKRDILDKNLGYIHNNIQAVETAIWMAKKIK